MANAAEAAVAGSDLRLQRARHAVAEAQVGLPDNAGAQPALAVLSALTRRRRAVDEFDFADRLHLRRPIGAAGSNLADVRLIGGHLYRSGTKKRHSFAKGRQWRA